MVEEVQSDTADAIDTSEQAWGSDLIADLLLALDFDYVPFNPGASFRGIEESIVNYNDNEPEVITTPNEVLSVSIAHGYAKATGDPSVCILHDVVGSLNGMMGIYNAYIDQVPVVVLAGNGPLRKSRRRPWIDWIHSAIYQGSLVQDIVKWIDEPVHTDGVAESFVRGYNITATHPEGPVYLTLDHDVQENELDEPIQPPDPAEYPRPSSMAAEDEALERAADMLVDADFPIIVTGRVGNSQATVDALVTLAETIGAAVMDTTKHHRFNFPNTHPLDVTRSGLIGRADVVLALNVRDVRWEVSDVDTLTHEATPLIEHDYDLIDIGPQDLEISGVTADYGSLPGATLPILADVENAIPRLAELAEHRVETAHRGSIDRRSDVIAETHDQLRRTWKEAADETSDETPISLPSLADTIWETIEGDEWVLVNGTLAGWAHRIWEIDSAEKFIGGYSGGGGLGYGIGAAIGGALAFRPTDRTPVNLQSDGDLMQYLGGLWVLGKYQIPLLTVVHNNGALYNSTNHRMLLAEHRNRDSSYERALIGTGLTDPVPDYATAADALGVNGYGPIEEPANLHGAIESAWRDAKNGEPALVDVVSQHR